MRVLITQSEVHTGLKQTTLSIEEQTCDTHDESLKTRNKFFILFQSLGCIFDQLYLTEDEYSIFETVFN